jgi:hypothetical protein
MKKKKTTKEKYNKNGSIKSTTKFEELDPKEHHLKNLNTMLLIMQDEYRELCHELLEKPLRNDERQSKLRQSMLEIKTEIKNLKNKK